MKRIVLRTARRVPALHPLKRRAFATVWMASVVSDIGTWMQITVLGLLIAKSSGSAVDVGIVMCAQFVPGIVGSPIGGILADRYDRRKILMLSLGAQALITALIAVVVASGERRAGVIGLFLLLQGLIVTMGQAISSAMQPDLVPQEELLAAASLGSASWNSGRVVGPALAFVVERWVGATGAVVANALSFALMGLAIWSLRRPYPPGAHAMVGSGWSQVKLGARTLWATPGCRAAVQGLLPMQFLFAPFIALLPLAAKELGGGQGLTSALSTSQGVGAVLGAAIVPTLAAKLGRDRTLQLHWAVTTIVVFGFGFVTSASVAVVAVCVFGGAFTGVLVTFMSLVARDAPAEVRGRVMPVFSALFGPTYGLGVAMQSVMANRIERTTTHHVAGLLGVMVLVVAVGGFSVLRRDAWKGWRVLQPGAGTAIRQ
jgi:MFS family permease